MKNFRVVSFYTYGTIYETIMMNYLLPCLDHLGMGYHIFGITDLKDWNDNANLQPGVILQAMRNFPNDNIVWLDSDTAIHRYPEMFERIPERCDIGLYYLKHEDHYGGVPPGVDMPKPELQSTVLFIKNTPKMQEFVAEWDERCKKKGTSRQLQLANLVDEKMVGDLSIFLLPRNYSYVLCREDGSRPAIELQSPVIVAGQASVQGKKDLYGGLADAT